MSILRTPLGCAVLAVEATTDLGHSQSPNRRLTALHARKSDTRGTTLQISQLVTAVRPGCTLSD